MRDLDRIAAALVKRTEHVFATAVGAERYLRLTARFEQLRGARELARLLDDWRLAHRIETQLDALRRDIERD